MALLGDSEQTGESLQRSDRGSGTIARAERKSAGLSLAVFARSGSQRARNQPRRDLFKRWHGRRQRPRGNSRRERRLRERFGPFVSRELTQCAARPAADSSAIRDGLVQRTSFGALTLAGRRRSAVAVCFPAGILETFRSRRSRGERAHRLL